MIQDMPDLDSGVWTRAGDIPRDPAGVVARFYASRGDRTVIDAAMSQEVVWDITPGFPYGGVHRGLDAVLNDAILPTVAQFGSFAAVPERFVDAQDGQVVVLGHYAASTADGRAAEARFVHIWTVEDDKIVRLDQVADTLVLDRLRKG